MVPSGPDKSPATRRVRTGEDPLSLGRPWLESGLTEGQVL